MEHFIQKFHSGWAYLALLLLIVAVANAVVGYFLKNAFAPKDRKISLVGLIAMHIQLLVGLILYFLSPVGFALLGNMETNARLTSLEHPLINIIAVTMITIGWSKHKKAATDEGKFKSITLFYAIGLILILIRIPWHLWL
jgi:NADH:ubiquinone oxidoreductase subunit 2 (subunit N)